MIKEIKKRYKTKLVKDVKIFQKRKRRKTNNMVVNVTKIFHKMKSKRLLRKKILQNDKKCLIIITRNIYFKKSFWSYKLLEKADLNGKTRKLSIKEIIKKTLKPYIKLDPKTIKFDDTDIEEFY